MGNLIAFTVSMLIGGFTGGALALALAWPRYRRLVERVGDDCNRAAQDAFDEASRADAARDEAEIARDDAELAATRAESQADAAERLMRRPRTASEVLDAATRLMESVGNEPLPASDDFGERHT